MDLQYLINNDFNYVGNFTKDSATKLKNGTVHYCTIESKKAGVYVLVSMLGDVVKIGETQNIVERIRLYAQGNQDTNVHVRESLGALETYRVYFYEAKSMESTFAGIKSRIIEDYKDAEGRLIDLYLESYGKLPILNKQRK